MAYPDAPINVHVTHPYILGHLDVRWDDARFLDGNVYKELVGYNVYRAYDTPAGPWQKLTNSPIGTTFYRDSHQIQQVIDEVPIFLTGNSVAGEFVVVAQNRPIVKPMQSTLYQNTPHSVTILANSNRDVTVTVNGQPFLVDKVVGHTGEIFLKTGKCMDPVTQKFVNYSVPPGSDVRVSYYYVRNTVLTNLEQRIYYRVSSVDIDGLETPVEKIPAICHKDFEGPDWMWKEAIRRVKWILEQAGEPAKLFIRKYVGTKCPDYIHQRKNAPNDCKLCYGTNIVGGYEGPYDILLAPPDQQKQLNLTDLGIQVIQTNNTFTLASPYVTQRDFVVKANGERHSIGPVTMPTVRGTPLLQFFDTSLRNEKDIIYLVPITGSDSIPADGPAAEPRINDEKQTVPAGQQLKGRTPKYGNGKSVV